MNRDVSQDEALARSSTQDRDTWWLSALEREIRRRIGWTDEAVSPFARRQHPRNADSEIRRAA
jgi:hypothetical protein